MPGPVSDPPASRTRLRWELGIVLALTLGRSAVYSLLSLVRTLLAPEPLSEQGTSLNAPLAEDLAWDAVYQILDVFFDLCLVALVVYLLWEPGRHALRRMGLDLTRPGSDAARAVLLVAVVGIPGLALYVGGRLTGITLDVSASSLEPAVYAVPLLILSALRAGLLEEVLFYGYFAERLGRLGWRPWTIIVALATLRACYHAYQGFGPLIGNFAMGLLFGFLFRRWGRVMPFVVAHTLIDVIAFVGYPLAAPYLP